MKYEVIDKILEQEKEIIYEGLLEYNLARIEDKHVKDLGIYLRDQEGNLVAGLIAGTHGNWLIVKYLWVSEELRGQKIGSQILQSAEKAAMERGCKYAFLDTFDFQAPMFYKKNGYTEVFVLDNYPITGKRYYFTKTL